MPLAAVVRAHAVARGVFGIDEMWDIVRPLDNRVAAVTQVELRVEATRLAERATRWLLRLPRWSGTRSPRSRRDGAVRRACRGGARGPAGVAARRDAAAYAHRAAPARVRGCAGRDGGRGRRRAPAAGHASTSRSWPSRPARRSRWPDGCCRASATGWSSCRCASSCWRCPATAAGTRWPGRRCATTSPPSRPRVTADVLSRRTTTRTDGRSWSAVGARPGTAAQRRAAGQLADIAAGDRHELAELLVAVRTLRGLRTRT